MCERRECSSKYIRYVRTGAGPYASGRPKKYTDSNFLRWEEDVCGVTRLSLPEGKALRRIVETHRMRCQTSKLRDFECFHLPHRIGFERGFDKLLVSYSLHALADCPYSPPPSLCSLASPTHRNPEVESLAISPEAAEETFRFLQHAAKTAVWSRACSPVRCWTKCCALCAARTWCVAWEWDLETEICSLSDQTPLEDAYPSAYPSVNGRGAAPGNLTFRRVVGAVQPMVERPAWVPASTSRGLPLQRDSARETRLRRRAARQAQGPRAAYAGPPRGDRCSASSGDRVVNE